MSVILFSFRFETSKLGRYTFNTIIIYYGTVIRRIFPFFLLKNHKAFFFIGVNLKRKLEVNFFNDEISFIPWSGCLMYIECWNGARDAALKD